MSGRDVRYSTADGVASVVFDRPEAYNAMTMVMYDQLAEACAESPPTPTCASQLFEVLARLLSPAPIFTSSWRLTAQTTGSLTSGELMR